MGEVSACAGRATRSHCRVLAGVLLAALLHQVWAGNADPGTNTHVKAGDTFSDCGDCPVMVVIPAGSNAMGSNPDERAHAGVPPTFGDREGPQHTVTIANPFGIGRTEVTRGSYARFVADTRRADPPDCAVHDSHTDKWEARHGYSWHDPGFPQTDEHPVVCVSYEDAVAYADWVGSKTRKPYRLASEAEWEYAARGGTTTAWYWGDDPESGCARANLISAAMIISLGSPPYWQHRLVCEDTHTYTVSVASYPANPFGVYDMIGNAFEWVADCSSTDHVGAPVDGSARVTPGCQYHFLKGGAFHTPIWLTRAAVRGNPLASSIHMSTIGFRVARAISP